MTELEQQIADLLTAHTAKTGETIAEIISYGTATPEGMRYMVRTKASLFRDENVIAGDVWIRAFLRDQGFDVTRVGRVIIDAELNAPLRIYIEHLGSSVALECRPFDIALASVVEIGTANG